MIWSLIGVLVFNVMFHMDCDSKRTCHAVERLSGYMFPIRLVVDSVGETNHADHHKHPTKLKRSDYDMLYIFIALPLRWLGIIHTSR